MKYGEGIEFHTTGNREVIRVMKRRNDQVELVLVTEDTSILMTMGSEVARELGAALVEAGQ